MCFSDSTVFGKTSFFADKIRVFGTIVVLSGNICIEANRESMEVRQRIINTAAELFSRDGIRPVTMTQVAEAAGVSKRTLYACFESKSDLLRDCIISHFEKQELLQRQMVEESTNPVDLIHRLFRQGVMMLRKSRPGFKSELRTLYPVLYNDLLAPMQAEGVKNVAAMLKDGVEKGYFHNDFDPEIASQALHAQIRMVTDENTFPASSYALADVFRQILVIFLRGCATPRGLKEIETLFSEDNLK